MDYSDNHFTAGTCVVIHGFISGLACVLSYAKHHLRNRSLYILLFPPHWDCESGC